MDTQQIEQAVAAGDRQLAVQLLDALAQEAPYDAGAACFRARMLIEIGRFERAAAAARQAIELDGHHVEAWLWLARANWSGGRANLAQQHYDRAREVRDGQGT